MRLDDSKLGIDGTNWGFSFYRVLLQAIKLIRGEGGFCQTNTITEISEVIACLSELLLIDKRLKINLKLSFY